MLSPQSLSEPDRRLVAAWAADCAERVLPLFEGEAPDAIARLTPSRGPAPTPAASSTPRARSAAGSLRAAPPPRSPVGEDAAGPFVAGGLLARGILGSTIHTLQTRIASGA